MGTKSLIEAVEEHRPNSRSASRDILQIYQVYSKPFNRAIVEGLFNVPVRVVWGHKITYSEGGKKRKRDYFKINDTSFYPTTVADFISIINSIDGMSLNVEFKNNESSAALLHKPNNNKGQ